MAMRYYEGDVFADFGQHAASQPEQHLPPVNSFEGETHTSRIEEDLVNFKRGAELLLEAADVQPLPPSGTKFQTNTNKFPLTWAGMQYLVFKQMGYGIYFADNAKRTDNGRALPDLLAVYETSYTPDAIVSFNWSGNLSPSDPNDNALLNSPEYKYETGLLAVLQAVSSGMLYAEYFDPKSNHSQNSKEYHEMRLLGKDFDELLRRGYMSSTLINRLSGSSLSNRPEYIAAYETLAEQGVRPLNHEELFGLTRRVIRYAMQIDKTFPPIPEQ